MIKYYVVFENELKRSGIMFKKLEILDEKDNRLRKKSIDATFPLSKEDKKLISGKK